VIAADRVGQRLGEEVRGMTEVDLSCAEWQEK
jgi:hypothetical protein